MNDFYKKIKSSFSYFSIFSKIKNCTYINQCLRLFYVNMLDQTQYSLISLFFNSYSFKTGVHFRFLWWFYQQQLIGDCANQKMFIYRSYNNILCHVVCNVHTETHVTLSYISGSGYASVPIRRCLFIDHIITFHVMWFVTTIQKTMWHWVIPVAVDTHLCQSEYVYL